MKSRVRSTVAAGMLLASAGAVLLAQPAAAQHASVYVQPGVVHVQPAPLPAPVIERFVVRTTGAMDPGREVRFRLVGTPGGQAWLDVPGVLRAAQMVETRPGVYEASYVLRWGDHPDAFTRAVATLQNRGLRATARAEIGDRGWASRPGRDDRPPQITDVTPDHGDRVSDRGRGRTRISARMSDEGSGIDTTSVRLRIDGHDVTGLARIEGDEVRYREDLAPGRHTAELLVRDRAGNASRKVWSFVVVDRDRGHGYGYGYGRGYDDDRRW